MLLSERVAFITEFLCSSKDGYLFDKEAILQYIITKKNEYSRKLKEYERQKRMEDSEVAENNAAEEQKKLQKFINTEHNIVGSLLSELNRIGPSAFSYVVYRHGTQRWNSDR